MAFRDRYLASSSENQGQLLQSADQADGLCWYRIPGGQAGFLVFKTQSVLP